MSLGLPKSVCVFCGSRPGSNPAHLAAATELGRALAENGIRLVYGAGDVGLMGAVARGAEAAGGATFGVIPRHLLHRESPDHPNGRQALSTYVVTETMHERKKVMFMNADAIVTLPGGPGSLDELFEVLTWRQLGLHDKPMLLLNTDRYWTPLTDLLAHMVAEGFADQSFLDSLRIYATVPELTAALRDALSLRQASQE